MSVTAFLTDSTLCIGCKACEVACKEWNGVSEDGLDWSGFSYDNTGAVGASTWRHVKFVEQEPVAGAGGNAANASWTFSSDVCKHCENAGCLEACPTHALPAAYVMHSELCISYLTIEFRGAREELADDLAAGMGNHIFGCDDCLDVCPFNLRAEPTTDSAFQPLPATLAPRLEELAGLDEGTFVERFRQSPIRRATLSGLRRNAAIAQENE